MWAPLQKGMGKGVGGKAGARGGKNFAPVQQKWGTGTKAVDDAGGVLGDFHGEIEGVGARFGFITCEDLLSEGYDKVFVLKDQLKSFKVGQKVRFTSFLDSQGRCQAKDLKVHGPKQVQQPMAFKQPMQKNYELRPGSKAMDDAGGVLGEFVGVVDGVGDRFGFIISDDLAPMGYGKVFVLADQMKAHQVGHKVRFTAYLDSQGRCQAKDLKSGMKGMKSKQPQQFHQPMAFNQPMWTGRDQLRPGSKAVDDAGGVLGDFQGGIEGVGDKFGFITCEDLVSEGYEKVFVLADQLKAYKRGHQVRFTAYLDSKGRCQAKDLKSGLMEHNQPIQGIAGRDEAGGDIGQFVGVVEAAKDKYGFMTCDALKKRGHEKVFILGSELNGRQAGQKVKFTAYLDSKGRCQAKNLK